MKSLSSEKLLDIYEGIIRAKHLSTGDSEICNNQFFLSRREKCLRSCEIVKMFFSPRSTTVKASQIAGAQIQFYKSQIKKLISAAAAAVNLVKETFMRPYQIIWSHFCNEGCTPVEYVSLMCPWCFYSKNTTAWISQYDLFFKVTNSFHLPSCQHHSIWDIQCKCQWDKLHLEDPAAPPAQV